MKRLLTSVLATSMLFASGAAFASSEKLYSFEAAATPGELAEGASGSILLEIKGKDGAYVSGEAPLKVTLAGTNVKLEKEKLSRGDVQPGSTTSPKFVVPFTAGEKGRGYVDADAVFFICTKNLCERQTKKVSIPITVK